MVSIAAFPKCWLEDISEGRMDLSEWIRRSAELECDGLEMYSRFLQSHDPSYLSRVRKETEALGMRIPMLCYSPDFTALEEGAYRKEIESQKQMIRVAGELGAAFCRTLSGQRRPELSRDDGIRRVASAIEECLPEAERSDVTLVIENHYKDGYWKYPEFAQKMDVFIDLIDSIDSPRFGVQYDPSNAIVAGDDPLELLDRVVDRVMTMHASDRYLAEGASLEELKQSDGTLGYSDKLRHGITGKGLNDYDAIFSKLKSAGFSGWISIEDGINGMEEMKESIDFLKRMREKYFA